MPVLSAVTQGYNLISSVSGVFSGQSQGFKEREAASLDFSAKRDLVGSWIAAGELSQGQIDRYLSLSFHNTDYNLRRENDAERAEMDNYIAWVKSSQESGALAGLTNLAGFVPAGVNVNFFVIAGILAGIVLLGIVLSRRKKRS